MEFDFKEEKEVKAFIENLGIEYRFGCYKEKKPEVCHLLGDFLESVNKDFEKAARLYKSTCDDYNFSKSCQKYASYAFLGKGMSSDNPSLALDYFRKGCELGDADSCLHAGLMNIMNVKNFPKEKNYVEGLKHLESACEKNNAIACFYVSGLFLSGVPNVLEKDLSKAFQLSTKSCELGNMYACGNLSQMYRKGDGVEKNLDLAEKYKNLAIELQEQVKAQRTIEFQQGSR